MLRSLTTCCALLFGLVAGGGGPHPAADDDAADSKLSPEVAVAIEQSQVTALEISLWSGEKRVALPAGWSKLPLHGFAGKLEIPLNRIVHLEMAEDRETATLELWNGDRLTGVIDRGVLPLGGKQQAYELHVSQIRSINVETSYAAPGNVAAASRGASVKGPQLNPGDMLDGESEGFTDNAGFAHGPLNEPWDVTLARSYLLHGIRFRLWDGDDRTFGYELETSADGVTFEPVADHSAGGRTGWQEFKFDPRLVKVIRLTGRANSTEDNPKTAGLFVVELEAYCQPPRIVSER